VLDKIGDGYQVTGKIAGQTAELGVQTVGQVAGWQIRQGGEAVAQVRLATVYVGAVLPMVQCAGAQWSNETTNGLLRAVDKIPFADRLFPGIDQLVERRERATDAFCEDKREQAAHNIDAARQDAQGIRGWADQSARGIRQSANIVGADLRRANEQVGLKVDLAFDEAGRSIRGVSGQAPTVLATGGAVVGTLGAAHVTFLSNGPAGLINLAKTGVVVTEGKDAAAEAVSRHGMTSTVIPSLDARTMTLEHEAIEQLARSRALQERLKPATESHQQMSSSGAGVSGTPIAIGLLLNQPNHPDYSLFRGAAEGVYALDARAHRVPDLRSDQLSGHLAVAAKREGLSAIDHVILSQDASRTFAVQGRLDDPAHQRAAVDTTQGLNTPLAQSTRQMAEVGHQHADKARTQTLSQQQEQETASRALRFA
jgi:hypothetical protein